MKRIPFEITDVDVLDLSEIIDDVSKSVMEDDVPEDHKDYAFLKDRILLYVELIGDDLGLIRLGDRAFVLDRHGMGEEVLDDPRVTIMFRVCYRIPEMEKYPITSGITTCGRLFPVTIPKSIVMKLPTKDKVHFEDFIMDFGAGLDDVYEGWRDVFMGIIN